MAYCTTSIVTHANFNLFAVSPDTFLIRSSPASISHFLREWHPISFDKSVSDMVRELEKRKYQIKWRQGVLLVADMTWFHKEAATPHVPWKILRALRDDEASSPDGLPTLNGLVQAASTMNQAQLRYLSTGEFPAMLVAAEWQALFLHLSRHADLREGIVMNRGVSLKRFPAPRATAIAKHPSSPSEGRPVSLRLRRELATETGAEQYVLLLETLSSTGSVLAQTAQRVQKSLPSRFDKWQPQASPQVRMQ
jgi:hypothetical protein